MIKTVFPPWLRRILWLVLLAAVLALQWQLWFGRSSYAELAQLRQRIEWQQQQNVELQRLNNQLQAQATDLQRGTDALEEVARNQLGLIREGEVFYMMVPKDE